MTCEAPLTAMAADPGAASTAATMPDGESKHAAVNTTRRGPREIQLNPRYRPPSSAGAAPSDTRAAALFLVHDGLGETLQYRALAEGLAPDVAVYGLHPMASDGVVMIHTRISDLAAAYVRRIRRLQPTGPYLLGGLCAGGVIACEMARQLQHIGEKVGMLAVMDSSDTSARMRLGRYTLWQLRRLRAECGRRLSRANLQGLAGGLFCLCVGLGRIAGEQVRAKTARIHAGVKARMLRHCLDTGRRPPKFLHGLTVNQIYTLAESTHAPDGRFVGDVLLFRASTSSSGDFGDEPFQQLFHDPLLGWGRRVTGRVDCVDVGGGHYTMLEAQHVRTVAEHIQRHIDALRALA